MKAEKGDFLGVVSKHRVDESLLPVIAGRWIWRRDQLGRGQMMRGGSQDWGRKLKTSKIDLWGAKEVGVENRPGRSIQTLDGETVKKEPIKLLSLPPPMRPRRKGR